LGAIDHVNAVPLSLAARLIEAKAAPSWTGDLQDDCTARWAGFLLRAEEMERGNWWYSVTDLVSGATVEDSNFVGGFVGDGAEARKKCEEAVRRFLLQAPAS
jgi:hypothetical protein